MTSRPADENTTSGPADENMTSGGPADEPIPFYTNLTDLYANLGSSVDHKSRWDDLVKEFEGRFGRKPVYIARAPGRVNLIGEHIDYALFGVLPAAIERDILIACAPRLNPSPNVNPNPNANPFDDPPDHHTHLPGSVSAQNLFGRKYTPQNFAPAWKVPEQEPSERAVHAEGWHLDINTKELRWESYVKAGYYGVLSHYFKSNTSSTPIPVDMLVTGSVPAGSGLSSSAAMVVASTLTFLAVNGKLEDGNPLNKGELVKMAMENEKRVGVNSGGMDQAASVMSTPSSALYISFYPTLTASPVLIPTNCTFVCANSLVVADKALSAKRGYNLRVVETLVGARILAGRVGVSVGEKERITYREVAGRLVGEKVNEGDKEGLEVDKLGEVLERLVVEVEGLKPKREVGSTDEHELGVTLDEMIELSGLEKGLFNEVYLSWVDVEATHFQLYKRAKHVYTEALRVLRFRKACLSSSSEDGTIEELGQLMNESQTSCAELFECSCPELDLLTKLAREAGAVGSRLTGAGWGGCTVSLVREGQVESFIAKIRDTYPPYKGLEGDKLNEVIFATRPTTGACVFKFVD